MKTNSRRGAASAKPWLSRPEWAEGRITYSNKGAAIGVIAFAVVWNAMSWPLVWVKMPRVWGVNWFNVVFLSFLLLVGMFLIALAVYMTVGWIKYGRSVFHMASVPGVIGGSLAGVIHVPVRVPAGDGFHMKLKCLKVVVTSSGSKHHTTEEVLWETDQVVRRELPDDNAAESGIPVLFGIPYDAVASDERNYHNRTVWRIEVSASTPGVDYQAQFEVPVFRTADSKPDFKLDESAIASCERK